ncbi:MAG TPA: hypothetical protein VF511_07655 [Chthoniobacterales bacterium]|jgi:hypothetical protein
MARLLFYSILALAITIATGNGNEPVKAKALQSKHAANPKAGPTAIPKNSATLPDKQTTRTSAQSKRSKKTNTVKKSSDTTQQIIQNIK